MYFSSCSYCVKNYFSHPCCVYFLLFFPLMPPLSLSRLLAGVSITNNQHVSELWIYDWWYFVSHAQTSQYPSGFLSRCGAVGQVISSTSQQACGALLRGSIGVLGCCPHSSLSGPHQSYQRISAVKSLSLLLWIRRSNLCGCRKGQRQILTVCRGLTKHTVLLLA